MFIVGIMCDKVMQMIQIEGMLFNIIDMVGICEVGEDGSGLDEVECIGIECIWVEVVKVDVILYMLDVDCGLMLEDEKIIVCFFEGVFIICIWNKIDCLGYKLVVDLMLDVMYVYLLVVEGQGVELLCVELLCIVGWQQMVELCYFVCEWYLLVLKVVDEYLVYVVVYVVLDNEVGEYVLDLFVEEL